MRPPPQRRAGTGLAFVFVAAIAACRPVLPPPVAPHLGAQTADAVFAAVRARERAVQTLRAQFVATMVQGNEERHADGVMLLKRPDRIRLRLVSAFGLTVLDYTRNGDHTRLVLPLEGQTFDDPAAAIPAAGAMDFGRLLLRLGDDPTSQCTARDEAGVVVVDCVGAGGGLVRQATIDPPSATVTRDVAFAGSEAEFTMALGDYRIVDETALPYEISISYPRTGARTEIRVRSYAVNPVLDDDLFAVRGSGR